MMVVLGTGTSTLPVELLSQRLLRDMGGLPGLSQARPGELARLAGIGPTKAARIVAAIELGRRVCSAPLRRGQRLRHSRQVFEAFGPALRDAQSEQFWAIGLDARHRVCAMIPVATGGLGACPVAPADVFRPLLRERAVVTIVLHNHPSGDPAPSPEDAHLTELLVQCGALLGVRILDHVIVGHGEYYSFLDSGALGDGLPSGAPMRTTLA